MMWGIPCVIKIDKRAFLVDGWKECDTGTWPRIVSVLVIHMGVHQFQMSKYQGETPIKLRVGCKVE